jgi:nucleotide-binding universal stress UspA family protein
MFKVDHILLPTNFSELSHHAAAYAKGLAETYQATLHVVHVIASEWEPMLVPESGAILPAEDVRALAERSLDSFVRNSLAGVSRPIVAKVLAGAEAREITRYASEAAIDLIVIGTHARGVVKRIFLGSISKAVLENAPCPVLMVPIVASQGASQADESRSCEGVETGSTG